MDRILKSSKPRVVNDLISFTTPSTLNFKGEIKRNIRIKNLYNAYKSEKKK